MLEEIREAFRRQNYFVFEDSWANLDCNREYGNAVWASINYSLNNFNNF